MLSLGSSGRIGRLVLAVLVVVVACGALSASAFAAGTITVSKGGTRSSTDTDAGYANALGGASFQYASWVADPTVAVWLPMCTDGTNSGSCTSASLANGRYLVREAPNGAPAGWTAFTELAWGGGSSGQSPTRQYVGDVTINNNNPTVHPSNVYPTTTGSGSGPFINAKANPGYPQVCGIDIALLLDRSGSINDTTGEAAAYKAAAQSFINSLAGTPTRVKIYSFAASASADQATFLNLSVPADVTTANNVINTVYNSTGGGTNWDAGLKLAATAGVDTTIVITDGNPTVRDSNDSDAGSGSDVDLYDLTFGIASANRVKTIGKNATAGSEQGAKVIAVGVGDGITAANLAAISGPGDYYASSLADLQNTLKQISNQLCGSRINVRKLTDEGNGQGFQPKAGWRMTVSGIPAPVSIDGITTGGISSQTTGGLGTATFMLDKIPAAGTTGGVTINEGLANQPTYAFDSGYCRTDGFDGTNTIGGVANGVATLSNLNIQRNKDWYCTFKNVKKPRLRVVKTFDDPISQSPTVTISVNGVQQNTSVGGTPQFAHNSSTNWLQQNTTTATITEGNGTSTNIADYTQSVGCDNSVTANLSSGTWTTSTLPTGKDVTCTLNNKRKRGYVKVVKALLPANDTGTFNLSVGGANQTVTSGPGNGTTSFGNASSSSYTPFAPNASLAIAEAGAGGTSLADYVTTQSCQKYDVAGAPIGSPVTSGTINLADGDYWTCTFTNKRRATVNVTKKVVMPAGYTTNDTFNLKIGSATTGGSPKADGGTFSRSDVAPDQQVTVGEFAPGSGTGNLADYTTTIQCGTAATVGGLTTDITPGPGSTTNCTVVNTRKTATIRLIKYVDGSANGFPVTVDGKSQGTLTDGQSTSGLVVPASTGGTSYGFAEGAPASDSLSNYVSTYVCSSSGFPTRGEASGNGSTSGTSGSVSVTPGQTQYCAFRNTRKANVTIAKQTVVQEGTSGTVFSFTGTLPGTPFTLTDDASKSVQVASGQAYTVTETNPSALGYVLDKIVCDRDSVVNTASGLATITPAAGASVTCTYTNRKVDAKLKVVKSPKNQSVFADGTASYTYTVTNPGTTPVKNVTIGDDKCPGPISGPTGDTGNDGVLTPGESWVYTCSITAQKLFKLDDADTGNDLTDVHNTVTVSGKDELGNNVGPVTDTADTHLNNPKISVDKTVKVNDGAYTEGTDADPSFAKWGDTLTFKLAVTNTGDVNLVPDVQDPGCGALSGPVKTGGDSDSDFEPGETWTYTCTHVFVEADGLSYHNVVTVEGSNPGTEIKPSDTDDTTTKRQPRVTIVKDVKNLHGGDADAGDFSFALAHDGSTVGGIPSGTTKWLTVGNGYLVTEEPGGPAGYTQTGASDDCQRASTAAQTDYTCTITNTDSPASLTVEKIVQNPNSKYDPYPLATPSDFTMEVTQSGVPGQHFAGSTAGTTVDVKANTAYSVDEADTSGGSPLLTDLYSKAVGTAQGDDCTGPLDPGDSASCTVTNTRKTGTITVAKVTDPQDDPGKFNLLVDSFKQTVDGGPNDGTTTFQGGDSSVTITVPTGTHSITETLGGGGSVSPAYDASLECRAGREGQPDTDGDISVGQGENWTCVFTNVSQAKLTVKKVFQGPSGDDKVKVYVDEVQQTVSGTPDTMLFGNGDQTDAKQVGGGSTHSFGEAWGQVDSANYRTPTASCDSGANSGSTSAGIPPQDKAWNVTVPAGADVTCTITNVRKAGTIEVVKSLQDQSGDDDQAFTITADGPTDSTDSPFYKSATVTQGGVAIAKFDAPTGGWIVSESEGNGTTDLGDYVRSTECRDEQDDQVDQNQAGQFTLQDGQDVVCTISNVRKPKLIVKKQVVNDAAYDTLATPDPSDWTLTAAQTGQPDKSDPGSSGGTPYTIQPFKSVSVTEEPGQDAPAGLADAYSMASDEGCQIDSPQPGHTYTCTIVNERNTAHLILEKQIVNFAGSDPGKFNLKLQGENQTTSGGTPGGEEFGDGDHTDAIAVGAGGTYDVSEAGAPGTSLDDYVSTIVPGCQDVSPRAAVQPSTSTQVTPQTGETYRCTFVNTRKPTVIVKKVVQDLPNDTTPFDFTLTSGGMPGTDFQVAQGTPKSFTVVPGDYSVTEGDSVYTKGYKLVGDATACVSDVQDDLRGAQSRDNTQTDDERTRSFTALPGATVTCTFTNVKLGSGLVLTKSPASQSVYIDGTASYTYTVTNNSSQDLTDVAVGDDKCSPLTRGKDNPGDDDNLLETGETWTYSCSVKAADLFKGTTAPQTNTATVTAKDQSGKVLTDKKTAVTSLLVPGIALDKTGPAEAEAGQIVTYKLNVTNTGNTSFPQSGVKLTDTVVTPTGRTCAGDLSNPVDKKGDATPDTLDPGETWVYQCQVQTQTGDTKVTNKGDVSGTDKGGKTVTATDNAETTLRAANVSPSGNVAGRARLTGTVGCVSSRYAKASVTGSSIKQVTFYVNGKKVKTLTKPNSGRNYQVRFKASSLKYGTYKVQAKVQFQANATPQSRTLNLQFSRCRPRVVKPKFTG